MHFTILHNDFEFKRIFDKNKIIQILRFVQKIIKLKSLFHITLSFLNIKFTNNNKRNADFYYLMDVIILLTTKSFFVKLLKI